MGYVARGNKFGLRQPEPLEPRQLLSRTAFSPASPPISTSTAAECIGSDCIAEYRVERLDFESSTGPENNDSGNVFNGAPDYDFVTFRAALEAGTASGPNPDTPANRVDPNSRSSPFRGVGSLQLAGATSDTFVCSGVLVDPTHVLTAGHCFDLNDDGAVDPSLVAGSLFNLNDGSSFSSRREVAAVAIHPSHLGFQKTSAAHDIAIVTLAAPVPNGSRIYPILAEGAQKGDVVELAGYGISGHGDSDVNEVGPRFDIKRSGKNVVDMRLEDSVNGADYALYIFDFDGPTGTGLLGGPTLGNRIETTVRGGDSGGPAFVQVNGDLAVGGINSFQFILGSPASGQFGVLGGGRAIDQELFDWIKSIATGVVEANSTTTPAAGGGGGGPVGPIKTIVSSGEQQIQSYTGGDDRRTHVSDDSYEVLAERPVHLEHIWSFDVGQAAVATIYVEAYHESQSEDFSFSYSTNGGSSYSRFLTLTKNADDDKSQSFVLPGAVNGKVLIKIEDTDPRNAATGFAYVDQLRIETQDRESTTPTPTPTPAPTPTPSPKPGSMQDFHAISEVQIQSYTGSDYQRTHVSDDSYETIGERPHSLDHVWRFNIPAGDVTTIHLEAFRATSDEEFWFSYSTNGGNSYQRFLTLTKSSDDDRAQSFILPSGISGEVLIKVTDAQPSGDNTLDFLKIDRLWISVEALPGSSPKPNPGPTAELNTVSEMQINSYTGGDITRTFSSDDNYENIVERPRSLSHVWQFDLPAGSNKATFFVEAYHNSSEEDFRFSYSRDGGKTYTSMFLVTKNADDDRAQSFVLPTGLSGQILIRVEDTKPSGDAASSMLLVDRMWIDVRP